MIDSILLGSVSLRLVSVLDSGRTLCDELRGLGVVLSISLLTVKPVGAAGAFLSFLYLCRGDSTLAAGVTGTSEFLGESLLK